MGKLRSYWRNMFDIRPGERKRVTFMGLYLLIVLFAYYILKPVSRGLFIFTFDIDELPYLYILIAAAGGVMAYVYTKIAIRASLKSAVNAATSFMAGMLVLIWFLLGTGDDWVLYFFNAFVSLFSITLVSQGWMVAGNVFDTREAKRVYGVLGLGAVLGAAFGGTFTALVVEYIGTRDLVLVSAALVGLAYLAFLGVVRESGSRLAAARGAEKEETFAITDVTQAVARYRHLQIIIAIIGLTYIVDVTVEFQFNAMAKGYADDQRELVAFLGQFFGIWLNLATFIFQGFLTAFVVSRFGVGGALQIMPVSITIASVFAFLAPGVLSAAATRLTEAATRYTFNRTGMELLYLPLPADLRNRTKAFTDIFVDRFSRGIGGLLLIALTQWLGLSLKQLSLVVIAYAAVWIVLSIRAKNEYVATVRKRLEFGRLDLNEIRVTVTDAATIRLLEEKAGADNARQAAYALSLLAEVRGYPLQRRLEAAVDSKMPEVRAKVFELARAREFRSFGERALSEIRSARARDDQAAIAPAVEYVLWEATDPRELAQRLLTHPNFVVTRSVVECLASRPDIAGEVITKQWIDENAASPEPARRTLAAIAVRIHGDADTSVIYQLLRDPDYTVAAAACDTAGALKNRQYLEGLVRLLPNARLRGPAIRALIAYEDRIVGTMADMLLDETTPASVRRQIPRVLRGVPTQRSVDALLAALSDHDLGIRSAVLKALNGLRENNPKLSYGRDSVLHQILTEARYYYEMSSALCAFRENHETTAARLLFETLQERLRLTLERLFRLLGLRYPPREIYAAYLAVNRRNSDRQTAALEFLDNVLERELKRIILPLLDPDSRLSEVGQEVFGLQPRDAQSALRELMRSGDEWLVSCAVATAAELHLGSLRNEIEPLSRKGGTEVGAVARSALASLTGATT